MAEQNDRDTPHGDGAQGATTAAPPAPIEAGAPDGPGGGEAPGSVAAAKQAILDNVAKGREEAGEKARGFAEEGKARASEALGQLSTLLDDAADQVDDRLGEQYGQYARQAADRVRGFSGTIDAKSVDDILADVSALVRKSPAVAVGVAAGLGFVVARLLTSGLDRHDA